MGWASAAKTRRAKDSRAGRAGGAALQAAPRMPMWRHVSSSRWHHHVSGSRLSSSRCAAGGGRRSAPSRLSASGAASTPDSRASSLSVSCCSPSVCPPAATCMAGRGTTCRAVTRFARSEGAHSPPARPPRRQPAQAWLAPPSRPAAAVRDRLLCGGRGHSPPRPWGIETAWAVPQPPTLTPRCARTAAARPWLLQAASAAGYDAGSASLDGTQPLPAA